MCHGGRSLVEGEKGKVSVEMFSPPDEDVLLRKNTHAAPVEVHEHSDNWNPQKEAVSCSVRKMTAKAPLSEALRKFC